MTNDVIKLNAIVKDIGDNISDLSQIGRDSFNVSLVTTPDELVQMIGLPVGPWRPLSHNLIWFYALKTTVYARQMLEEARRIFEQIEDEDSAYKVQSLIVNPLMRNFIPVKLLFKCTAGF
jgi:hypothetical protein